MVKVIRPRRQELNPDQFPLITPDSSWKRPKALPDLRRFKEFSIDTENKDDGLAEGRGPGWVYGAGHVAGISAAWRQGKEIKKIYIPVRHPDTDNFDHDAVRRWLKDHFESDSKVVFQNAPYDIGWLNQDFGVRPPKHIDDVGCMAVLIDETQRSYSLDAIAARLGIPGKDETLLREAAHAYGFNPNKDGEVKRAIAHMPARYAAIYGEQDAVSTLMAKENQIEELASQGLLSAYALEMDLIPIVHAMRKQGIRMDMRAIDKGIDHLYGERDKAFNELQRLMGGRTPTIDDIRQQKWLLSAFSNVGVEYSQEDDKASFGKDWMRQGYVGRYTPGRQGHWLPQLIARAKQCHDAADKFLKGFLQDFAHNGRIHASINQFLNEDGGTRTHRFSYSDPPLQQMPSRPEKFLVEWTLTADIAKIIRACFLPERGDKWFSPDYSQQEYRLIVHYAALKEFSKAREAMQKYVDDPNTDFHNLVVEMTGLERRSAKDVNFAKSYGAGIPKFASMTGMTDEKAGEVMTQYDTEMPFVKRLNEFCNRMAQQRGWIKMIDGARLHFNTWEPARWIDWQKKQEAVRAGYKMNDCGEEEAMDRIRDKAHPWFGMGLKRALTHKAMNALIQGGAARQMKRAMKGVWDYGVTPLLQMHDELPCSINKEKDGKAVAQIMRDAFPKSLVPFRVDEEYGKNWGDAKHAWKDVKVAA